MTRSADAHDATPPVTVVIATRNRRDALCATLDRLTRLPGRPPVIVVDNASTDGSAEAVARLHPGVRVLRHRRNTGAAARNLGVAAARTPYVAFSDDDSWWAPDALAEATRILAAHPTTALVAARLLVGPDDRPDPVNELLAHSPLRRLPGTPGPAVLGFLACAAVVRRDAYLRVGGFEPLLLIGGEEQMLAWDLAACGWNLAYTPSVVAHHHPSPVRDPAARRARQARNSVLVRIMRRPVGEALSEWLALVLRAPGDSAARRAALSVLGALPAAIAKRRRLPDAVLRDIALVERASRTAEAVQAADADADADAETDTAGAVPDVRLTERADAGQPGSASEAAAAVSSAPWPEARHG